MADIKGTKQGEKSTELVFVIDRSGSMGGLESDTIGGVNSVLDNNRKVDGEAHVTTILFDNQIEYLHDHEDLSRVGNLTDKDYWVRGATALLDAVGEAITHTRKVQSYLPEDHRAGKIIVTIVTDGMENCSERYTYRKVKHMIEGAKKHGWEFLFLGANIDVAAEADKLGIDRDMATGYVSDARGTDIAYEAVAHATVASRVCGAVNRGWADRVRHDKHTRG